MTSDLREHLHGFMLYTFRFASGLRRLINQKSFRYRLNEKCQSSPTPYSVCNNQEVEKGTPLGEIWKMTFSTNGFQLPFLLGS